MLNPTDEQDFSTSTTGSQERSLARVPRPVMVGLQGYELLRRERALIADMRPIGLVLFRRNIEDQEQVLRLMDQVDRAAKSWSTPDFPFLAVDQEGGRVQRFGPPNWPNHPAPLVLDAVADEKCWEEAVRALATLLATCVVPPQTGVATRASIGPKIRVIFAPVLDLSHAGASDVVGDRAASMEPDRVLRFGQIMLETFRSFGVQGVVKHLPGHGRAAVDTHKGIAHIGTPLALLDTSDFVPFRTLAREAGMVAHVSLTEIDECPATISPRVVQEVIRERLGFRGLLFSDALEMEALSGDIASRVRGSQAAGVDILLATSGRIEDSESALRAVDPDRSVAGRVEEWFAQAAQQQVDQGADKNIGNFRSKALETLMKLGVMPKDSSVIAKSIGERMIEPGVGRNAERTGGEA